MERVSSQSRVWELLGAGYRVRVPRAPGMVAIELRDGLFQRTGQAERPRFLLDPAVFGELVRTQQIAALTEYRNGAKCGWREAGYDGEVAEWYCAVQ